jgi:IstB-like ATP binding protein
MDRRPRQPRSGRPIRRRQELVGLRHRPEGLPRQSLRPLSSLAKALRRPGARPGRRGRHPRLIKSLGRADLLILDDFGLEPLDAGARHDLLEILEERYGRRSTIVTSQLPLSAWHEVVGDPTTPTPSWTASSTTRIASNSPAKACAEPKANSQRRLDPKPRKGRELS